MLCLALSGLVEDKNIIIKKKADAVWKSLKSILFRSSSSQTTLFPHSLVPSALVCIESWGAKYTNSSCGVIEDDSLNLLLSYASVSLPAGLDVTENYFSSTTGLSVLSVWILKLTYFLGHCGPKRQNTFFNILLNWLYLHFLIFFWIGYIYFLLDP